MPAMWMRGAAVAGLLLLTAILGVGRAQAQTPEARALQIEQRLLCPQCTNLRLDVCDTQICADMRTEIRDRLARGQSEQEIVDYFQGRYGQRVLADVPRRGFNLLLFGWVGGSLVAVAAAGTLVLWRLRRTATPWAGAGALPEADERWLDEQLHGEEH
jgi:cytochrome c-type biogenesis protein CcmH